MGHGAPSPKSDTPRRVVEIVARALGMGVALFIIVYLINYGLDTREIWSRHGTPTISGKLTDQRYTALAWVCYQSITILRPDGSTENYSLFFHPRVPIGRNCMFRILPWCKTILSIEVSAQVTQGLVAMRSGVGRLSKDGDVIPEECSQRS
jgi:hypothetical protein